MMMMTPCPKCGSTDDAIPCPSCGHDRNIGLRVGDRFVVESLLGAGGMGSIYRGHDERLGEPVAIKLLKSALVRDAILRERFRREALSLAKLRHPGIVTVLDFGEVAAGDGDVAGNLYTVLELVSGKNLADVLDEAGAISALRAAPIFDQILAALEVCHEHDVIHRDIKPSNIMLGSSVGIVDHATLLDFGLARTTGGGVGVADTDDKLTETGVVQGTPHYMAPEQCRGEEVTTSTDIYASGVLFYEMLVGKPPFQGSDAATFMAQHLFVDAPPLRNAAPHVSSGVAAAIHSALAKRAEDRPTARELRQALASAFKGTDPQTLADASSVERRRVAGLPRSERALTGRPQQPLSKLNDQSGNVMLWMANDERSARLLGVLGTAGIPCTLWARDDEAPEGAVVIILRASHIDRFAVLRKQTTKLSIVVVDVDGPEGTTKAIRAGASDMLLREASDADLAPKIKTLLARKRRA